MNERLSDGTAAASGRGITAKRLAIGIAVGSCFVAIWLRVFAFPIEVVSPSLDRSWAAAVVYFADHRIQFGRDVIFTYGPLAHLISQCYAGSKIPAARIAWEFAATSAMAATICLAMMRLPWLWRAPFGLYVLLFFRSDLSVDGYYNLTIVAIVAWLFAKGRAAPKLNLVACGFGAVALIKFSYFVAVLAAIGPLLAFYATTAAFTAAAILAASVAGGFLICWIISGQALGNLASYVADSIQVASGYKEAMGVAPDSTAVLYTGAAAGLLGLALATAIVIQRPSRHRLCVATFLIGSIYLAWNRGFIRADDHVAYLFTCLPVVTLLALYGTGLDLRPNWSRNSAVVLLFVLCLIGLAAQRPENVTRCIPNAVATCQRAAAVVMRLGFVESELERTFQKSAQQYALPRIKAAVGDEPIDVFGYEQGIALLNRLNYTPRYAFQSYSAYTEKLIEANAKFYASDRAPKFVLLKCETIDGRYPAMDDSAALREIVFRYEPLLDEAGYTLWRRRERTNGLTRRPVTREKLRFEQSYPLPAGQPLSLRLAFRRTLAGRLLNLIYKPPVVEMQTVNSDGTAEQFRIVPSMTSAGFLVSPEIRDGGDVAAFSRGLLRRSITSFRIAVAPSWRWFYRNRIDCEVIAMPNLRQPVPGSSEAAAVVR